MTIQIDCIILGDFQTNCYIVRESQQAKECLIIDPGLSPKPLLDYLERNNVTPQRIILTHGHGDHIAGIPQLQDRYTPLPVTISTDDAPALIDSALNLSAMIGMPMSFAPPDQTVSHGDSITLGSIDLTVIATPGHTVGGISLYCPDEHVVFTGDALFAGSIGRHDFPGGDLTTLLEGIRRELFTLPDDTRVLSGHGPETTIGVERRSNPFF